MEILVDTMLCVTGDGVNFALAFNDGVLACRNRHARLFDPFARIGCLRRHTGHIALFLDGFWNVGDRLVVQAEKERKFLFCCHDKPQVRYSGTKSPSNLRVSSIPSRATS